MTIFKEIVESFQVTYVQTLKSRLAEFASEGELDSKVGADGCIEGDILTGCDEYAYSQVRQEGWRLGTARIEEMMQEAGPDVYDGIDYDAIVAEARALQND